MKPNSSDMVTVAGCAAIAAIVLIGICPTVSLALIALKVLFS